ncbi:zinc protease PQQL-like isoform X2 [Henckelia pumila]|uniref:zinc protease PQQL-like isoform X2 n=1 Tax=Henckelia pumila TaxID=405737 RepID=UPI003C6E1F28
MEDVHLVNLLCKLMEENITGVLRLQHGKTYVAQVCEFLGFNNPSRESEIRGEIKVVFSCDPNDSHLLVNLTLDKILRLQNEGPSTEEVLTILKTEQKEHDDALQDNEYWLAMILGSYRSRSYSGDVGASFEDDNEGRARARDNFTPAKAQSTLQRIIPFPCTKQYILAIQMPES